MRESNDQNEKKEIYVMVSTVSVPCYVTYSAFEAHVIPSLDVGASCKLYGEWGGVSIMQWVPTHFIMFQMSYLFSIS